MKIIIGRTKKGRIARLALLAVLVMSAAALAAWFTSSQSDARGRGASLTAPTVVSLSQVEQAAIAGDLFPGQLGSAWVKVTNPNPFPVYLSYVEYNSAAVTITVTGDTGCATPQTSDAGAASTALGPVWLNPDIADGTGITLTNAQSTAAVVAANASNFVLRVPDALKMHEIAAQGCAAKTFAVTGASAQPIYLDFATSPNP